jgi:hypothetical protein
MKAFRQAATAAAWRVGSAPPSLAAEPRSMGTFSCAGRYRKKERVVEMESKRVFVSLIAAGLFVGCGPTLPPNKTVVPASGKAFQANGEPAKWLVMDLVPDDMSEGHPARAFIKENGTFEIYTYSGGEPDGAVPGVYSARFEQTNAAGTRVAEETRIEVEIPPDGDENLEIRLP